VGLLCFFELYTFLALFFVVVIGEVIDCEDCIQIDSSRDEWGVVKLVKSTHFCFGLGKYQLHCAHEFHCLTVESRVEIKVEIHFPYEVHAKC